MLLLTKNWATNGGAENGKTGWTASGTSAVVGDLVVTTTAAGKYEGNGAFTWTPHNADNYLTNTSVTITSGGGLSSANCAAIFWTKTTDTTHALEAYDGTNVLSSVTIPSSTTFVPVSINWICPASGTVQVRFNAGSTTAISFDSLKWGDARGINISQVTQATLYGSIKYAGTSLCSWTTGDTGAAYTEFGVDTDCPTPTTSGAASAPSTKVPRVTFTTLPPGDYLVIASGQFSVQTASTTANFQYALSDGTTKSGLTSWQLNSTTSTNGYIPNTLSGRFSYTTAQSSLEFRPVALSSSNSNDPFVDDSTSTVNFEINVYRFPTTAETAYRQNSPKFPTTQVFTSGTAATYTRPVGVSWIEIDMWGGGGGGAASGTTAGGTVGDGVASTFSSLLTAPGGSKGIHDGLGGAGGAAVTVTAPAIDLGSVRGTDGGASARQGSSVTTASPALAGGNGGGPGGGSGGVGGGSGAGQVGVANTGGGGGGGYGAQTSSVTTGSGGGSGSHLHAAIIAPSGTYTYTVGTGGAGGTLGTSGAAGANGADGKITVTEHYGAFESPLLLMGVTTPQNTGGSTVINNWVTKSSSYTATSTDETIQFTATATLTLPPAASYTGKKYHVTSTTNTTVVTIDPNASETVCGQTTIKLTGNEDGIDIQSDGTNWKGLNGGCNRTIIGEISHTANSTCSVVAGQGTGHFTVSCSSAGVVSGSFTSGLWSSTPTCLMTLDENVNDRSCRVPGASTSGFTETCTNAAGTGQNVQTAIMCFGPR